ncbi:MAG: LysR family transcriptional regulator [Gammaproteobacteria bacterium]|nr:MAG: LysR family transcriptional regulator [Gammaproteobacteria bacterium]
MDLRKLEIFRSVAEHRSFARAAQSLYISQSAVSIAVRKLEEELGVRLFSRDRRSVRLTAEGEVLLRHAARLLAQAQQARLELQEMVELVRGEVRIGIPAMLAAYHFPPLLAGFRELHPGLRLVIIDEGTRLIRQHLEEGRVDMGIVSLDEEMAGLEAHPLLEEEMLLCIPAGHPLARRKWVGADDLAGERLILYREGYFLREIVDRMFAGCREVPEIGFETNLVQLMKELVLSGQGVSVCLRCVLREERRLAGVPFRPAFRLPFGLAWRKGDYLSRANRAFADFLLQGADRLPDEG